MTVVAASLSGVSFAAEVAVLKAQVSKISLVIFEPEDCAEEELCHNSYVPLLTLRVERSFHGGIISNTLDVIADPADSSMDKARVGQTYLLVLQPSRRSPLATFSVMEARRVEDNGVCMRNRIDEFLAGNIWPERWYMTAAEVRECYRFSSNGYVVVGSPNKHMQRTGEP